MKQNNDIPDKIMERIRKLMRLKESTTSEGEARETALTCCHDALIDKYLEKIGAGTSKAHPRKTGTDWKSHSTLTLLATQNYPFLLKYDCPLWLK